MKKLFKIVDNNTFMNYEENCFTQYINNNCEKLLLKNRKYKNLKKRLEKLKRRFPKVRNLLDDFSVKKNITYKDNNVIQEALVLQEQMNILKNKVIFRLGEKEMLNFFMDVKIDEDEEK